MEVFSSRLEIVEYVRSSLNTFGVCLVMVKSLQGDLEEIRGKSKVNFEKISDNFQNIAFDI